MSETGQELPLKGGFARSLARRLLALAAFAALILLLS